MANRTKQNDTGIGIKFHAIAFIFVAPVLYVLYQKSIISGGMASGIGGAFLGPLIHSLFSRYFCRSRGNDSQP